MTMPVSSKRYQQVVAYYMLKCVDDVDGLVLPPDDESADWFKREVVVDNTAMAAFMETRGFTFHRA